MNRTALYVLIGVIVVFLLWLFLFSNNANAPVTGDVNQRPSVSVAPEVSPTSVPTSPAETTVTVSPTETTPGVSPTGTVSPTTQLTPSPTQ